MANKCAHCGAPGADEEWELKPCALQGEAIDAWLCPPCDVALNSIILDYFKVRGRKSLIAKYQARIPPTI